jgi:LPXTG-motif cell wall-anchored protein
MICDQLPNTGLGAELWPLLAVAFALLAVGAFIALAGRRRRAGVAVLFLMAAVVSTGFLSAASPVQARQSSSQCSTTSGSIRVWQTSVMQGLAPGIAPDPIAGLVENTGAEQQLISTVDVQITGVSPAAEAAAGSCDASDYVLLDTRMQVDRLIDAGQRVAFAGASIGFSDKPVVQDACQNAVVHLLYTVNATAR